MENEKLLQLLKEFAIFVQKKIEEEKKIGNIKQIEVNEEYFKWKVEGFNYTLESGVTSNGARGQLLTKKRQIFKHDTEKIIKETEEYKKFISILRLDFDSKNLESYVDLFVGALAHKYLYESKIDENTISTFAKELNEEPIKIGAIIELDGFTLEPDSIQLSRFASIRRAKLEDLEKETPIYPGSFNSSFLHYLSAIMEINKFGNSAGELQKDIEKYVTIMRLFKVGEVYYLTYRMHSESISYFVSGTITSNKLFPGFESYVIYNKDVDRLKSFFHELEVLLPEKFYGYGDSSEYDYIHFAYKRYWDSLSSRSSYEQQVSNAIIGLESLFSNEFQEISKFLTLRMSKFLGFAGFNPYKIRESLKEGYKIRSLFVHGNQLSYKGRNKLKVKFGTEKDFLIKILDYLRVSTVILLVFKKQKDELIDLIDDTFIDKQKEESLSKTINGISEKLKLVEI